MIEQDQKFYKEVRCTNCRALLCFEYIYSGRLMIKCRKCGEINTIQYKTKPGMIKKLQENENPDDEIILNRDVKMKGGEKHG